MVKAVEVVCTGGDCGCGDKYSRGGDGVDSSGVDVVFVVVYSAL